MYAKVRRSMFEGTLAGTAETWAVFVFLLAHSDPEGFVDIHPKVISRLSGFDEPAVRKALGQLEAADFNSRRADAQGARIVRLDEHRDWGWHITNYVFYRCDPDMQTVREQTKARVRKYRSKHRGNATVTDGNGLKRQVDVDGEVEADTPKDKTCPEASPSGPLTLPALSGKSWTPTPSELSAMVEAYPGVRVEAEFAKMRVWLMSNRSRMKTDRGLPRFANKWLAREQDTPRGPTNTAETDIWDVPESEVRR